MKKKLIDIVFYIIVLYLLFSLMTWSIYWKDFTDYNKGVFNSFVIMYIVSKFSRKEDKDIYRKNNKLKTTDFHPSTLK